jgi:hypothetical protein
MSRRDDPAAGYLQIDETGRITVLGAGLRDALREYAGYYTHLPSDRSLLHFQRATQVPTFDEFRDLIVLQGDIAGMGSTIEVINFVNSSKLSGNLVFVVGDVRKCLYFKNGEVRGASSNQVEDRLGEIMYRFGALTRVQLDQSLEEARRIRRPLGNYLLDRGVINQADLYVYVRRQVEETFYSILMFKAGDFYLTAFDVDALPSPLSLNAQSMLMEGLRRLDELAYFKQKIPGPQSRIARAEAPQSAPAPDAKEQVLLSLLEQPMTVDDLTRTSRLGDFESMKLLFHLVQSGHIQVLEARDFATEGLDTDHVTTEMSNMVETFNSVFQRIYEAISRHGRQDALEQGLETFLQFYGFVELFHDVTFDEQGRLDKTRLLQNLQQNPMDNRVSFLSQALNELLFFEMFAAREWLEREEQQDLQKIINQLFIEIG